MRSRQTADEDIYWHVKDNYVDSWDLENYAYIRTQLDSKKAATSNSMATSQKSKEPPLSSADYADIDDMTTTWQRRRWSQHYYDRSSQRRPYSESIYDSSSPPQQWCQSQPIYDAVRGGRQPAIHQQQQFGLTNYGHLKIDYSVSWKALNNFIRYHQ